MKFLEDIAQQVWQKYGPEVGKLTLIFPNKRAGLFFRKHLAKVVNRPVWSPAILTIEEFIRKHSDSKQADKLDLIYELYKVFCNLSKREESFEKFFYWGDIILQDFDEVDKFMVDAELLFKNLAHTKLLESDLGYLDESQKELIAEFWNQFDTSSNFKSGFLSMWNLLSQTYKKYKEVLALKNMSYDGMVYRQVADELQANRAPDGAGEVVFAGFNALSKSEEVIISAYVAAGARIYWDADDHYLNDQVQEAGKYMRAMKQAHNSLGTTFLPSYGNAFSEKKQIEIISVASEVGQAQIAARKLQSWGVPLDENTALVLPDSGQLFPVLHALPDTVSKMNVTMGYPLKIAPVFGLLDTILLMQTTAENKTVVHFRSVLSILRHPLLAPLYHEEVEKLIKRITDQNIVWVLRSEAGKSHEVLQRLFDVPKPDIAGYLSDLLHDLASLTEDELQQEFYYHFIKIIKKLEGFIRQNNLSFSLDSFRKLFAQMVRAERLPFEGEPLLGLQVMGLLETRNLDFDNLIILSANEGKMPPASKANTLVPHSLRRAFEMPVTDHQDAIYAYVFYRLMQRAQKICLIYNSSEETGKSGEVTRFVKQLEQESQFDIKSSALALKVSLPGSSEIVINKNEFVLQKLHRYSSVDKFQKRFTPTALNTYLDCSLKFYFTYILDLRQQEEVTEEVDARVFGNILHHTMENLYKPFDQPKLRRVTAEVISQLKGQVDEAIDQSFARHFVTGDKKFRFEGKNVLAREIIKKMVMKVLDHDAHEAPFEILGLEAGAKKGYVLNIPLPTDSNIQVGLSGILDRIELKDDMVRVIDYKTGSDKKDFMDIASLFDRTQKTRKKAVFQTFMYGLLYFAAPDSRQDIPLQSWLFNIRELFDENFSPLVRIKQGKAYEKVMDVRAFLDEFKSELARLLEEIFDENTCFEQTEDIRKCSYCAFAGMCRR